MIVFYKQCLFEAEEMPRIQLDVNNFFGSLPLGMPLINLDFSGSEHPIIVSSSITKEVFKAL